MKMIILIIFTLIGLGLLSVGVKATQTGVVMTTGANINYGNGLVSGNIVQNSGIMNALNDKNGVDWIPGGNEGDENHGTILYNTAAAWMYRGETTNDCFANNTMGSWRGVVWTTIVCRRPTVENYKTWTIRTGASYVDEYNNISVPGVAMMDLRGGAPGGTEAGKDVMRLSNAAGTEQQITYGTVENSYTNMVRMYINLLDYASSGQHMVWLYNITSSSFNSIYSFSERSRADFGMLVCPGGCFGGGWTGLGTNDDSLTRTIFYTNTTVTGDDQAQKYGSFWNDTNPAYITPDTGTCSFARPRPENTIQYAVTGDVLYCNPAANNLKVKLALNPNITTAWLMVENFTYTSGMTIYGYNASAGYATDAATELCFEIKNETGTWKYQATGKCAGADVNVAFDAPTAANLTQPSLSSNNITFFMVFNPTTNYYLTLTDTPLAPPNTAPKWSDNNTVNNSAGSVSYFNITWTDSEGSFNASIFESNYTGTPKNYTNMTQFGNGIYNYNTTIGTAGRYYWKSYGNDTSNAANTTDTWFFDVIVPIIPPVIRDYGKYCLRLDNLLTYCQANATRYILLYAKDYGELIEI